MNSDEDPDFYGGNEEEEDEGSQKEDKKKINLIKRKEIKGNADFTLNDGEEEDEIKIKKKNKNEKKEEILKELKQENKKKDIKKDELNNSRDYGEDDDNNEPDFYALEEDGNDYYQSSDSENNNYNIKNKENIDEKRIQEKLKKLNIDINNIYEINNKFNYSKDLPVFYIREEQKSFDNYPIPLSTNQLVEMIKKNNIPFEEVMSLDDAMPPLDILYMTRVQRERFFNEEDYIRLKDSFILNVEKMKLAREDMLVLHPLPRVNEISVEVDDDPRAVYFKQAEFGVYVRMALILTLLGLN